MAETPVYGLRTPDPGETPNVPLDMQELAEDVEAELERIDTTAADLVDRVTALETGAGGIGWIPITSGSGSGTPINIDMTDGGRFPSPPAWDCIKLQMRFDLDAEGNINLRINGDSDAVYRSGGGAIDSLGTIPVTTPWHFPNGGGNPFAGSWRIAHGATVTSNNMELTLFHTGPSPSLIGFQCTAGRQSDAASSHRYSYAHGSLNSAKTLSSLSFILSNGATSFTDAWWWVEGLRMTHPS
jgi:hypothetical protein